MNERPSDSEVWRRLNEMLPVHSCGRRLQAGGLSNQPILVCVQCAYIEEIDPDWAADMAFQARTEAGSVEDNSNDKG